MSLPHPYNVSGGPAGIETSPRRRQTPNQPPNLLTTSLGNARNAALGLGGVVQTPISSTTLSSPFSAHPQSTQPQSPGGAMREASPMASRSASGFSGYYNPQQWGAVNNVSSNSMSMTREYRQTSHLAPRPVGPDEPVASPPPPYSPRRDQQSHHSPRHTSEIISPAVTTSPDTEYSPYGTPVSAATTISPDLVSRRSPLIRQHTSLNETPNAALAPSFPPPPGQRIHAGSKNPTDRLLSSLTLKGKASKDTLQNCTAQTQASSATSNDPTVHPPAARRAASTGGIGLAGASLRSTSQSPSPVTWEPNIPLPPPPPGPPPRSQSLNRPIDNSSSGIAPTFPFRFRGPPGTGASLETVPPTPADWREEDGTNGQVPPSRDRSQGPLSLNIDTGSILRKRRSGADFAMIATARGSAHPRRDSSARYGFTPIRPIVPTSQHQALSDQIAILAKENADLRALQVFADQKIKALTIFGAHQDEAIWLLMRKFKNFQMAGAGESDREVLEQDINSIASKADDAVTSLRRQFPSLEELVSRHDDEFSFSISPALGDMQAESRIRREQYASVFEEEAIEVNQLAQGLFGHDSTDKSFHDRQQSLSGQDTSIASSAFGDSSSPSSAVSRKHESLSSASSTQQQPESTYWKEDYVPCLSPIASMSIVTGQDEIDSRGRAASRWFENQSHSGDGLPDDAFKVLQRTKRESKYMGVPALYGNIASASTGAGQWQPGAYGPNQYPPEKTELHEQDPSTLPFLPPTPSSAPFTPDPRTLDISRLITLPPPYPRHHPSVNNSHPELASERAMVRSLHEKEGAEIVKDCYLTQSLEKRQRGDSWCKHQRSLREHGEEVRLEEGIANCEQEVTRNDFELYQRIVLGPLHTLFSDRIRLADASLDQLSSRLSQSQSPNLLQEEGDEVPELLEILTQAKWLFEARETLYRQIYEILSERNNRYKAIVLLPYKQTRNLEKHAEAELFFAKDAQERRSKFEQAVCNRAEAFLSLIENNVSRGVESQLGAVRTSPAHYTFVQGSGESRNIVSGLPCSPKMHNADLGRSVLGHSALDSWSATESAIGPGRLLGPDSRQ